MLEHTKKLNTEIQEARFLGPPEKIKEIIETAERLGVADISDTIPWRELFPDVDEEDYPAMALRGARGKEEITQEQLSEMTGISADQIAGMEKGTIPIDEENALRLGRALRISYKVFL
ncbi:MAG: helix-turn-helix transcriptional regulator [Deltaproteobacteria bacterium]|nr:helix-turn-helix transcriptional regulator [Deltaproteobacteria bacterium]